MAVALARGKAQRELNLKHKVPFAWRMHKKAGLETCFFVHSVTASAKSEGVFVANKIKVYLDTSVISYLDQQDAPEKMQETREVWDYLKAGRYDICISDVVLDEIGHCREDKQKILLSHLQQIEYTLLRINENTIGLAEKFVDFGILK